MSNSLHPTAAMVGLRPRRIRSFNRHQSIDFFPLLFSFLPALLFNMITNIIFALYNEFFLFSLFYFLFLDTCGVRTLRLENYICNDRGKFYIQLKLETV